jgi:hypothetical protein
MNLIGFLSTIFVGFTIINSIIGGEIVRSGNITNQFNNILMFRSVNLGIITFPVPNLNFIFDGLPHLVNFQYSFFGGNAQLIMYFLYTASAAIAFVLFLSVVGVAFYKYGMH